MLTTFDTAKDVANLRKHGISLARVSDFDFATAQTDEDDSQDYGETRYIAIGFLDANLHVLVFTESESIIHAISLRPAEPSERKRYASD